MVRARYWEFSYKGLARKHIPRREGDPVFFATGHETRGLREKEIEEFFKAVQRARNERTNEATKI